ncbi:uncharacterized protein LOC119607191 [Lucilia sericata]|uniref:uncharacterized protein LOC119607191 n=1 Tax=Lucilia sericata TaxID=13632 RepID=UPI0018A88355|nr:uncharacterized protein LOC119607191 [Lucilia sericata]
MPGGYNLRSSRSVRSMPSSPSPTEHDELNTTMMEPPSVSSQLADVIASLNNLAKVVVESRNDIDLLKQQIRNIPSTTNLPNEQPGTSQVALNRNTPTANSIIDRNCTTAACTHSATDTNPRAPSPCTPSYQQPQQDLGNSIYFPAEATAPCHVPEERRAFSQQFVPTFEPSCKLYDLPLFSGNPDEWPLFIANYKDTTETFKYNDRQNLMRLQKCLAGTAREAVASMLVYPDNVPNVIEELEFRFGRPDILVRSQLQKIQQFPVINRKKMDQIIIFSTKVRNVVAFLTSAGCSHHLMSTTLLEEMVSKLPDDQQFDWVKSASIIKPFPTVTDFSKWLGDLAKVVSLMPNYVSSSQSQPVKQMVVLDSNKKSNVKCTICDGDHTLSACKAFTKDMTLPMRWEKIKQLKLCFSCLRKGHSVNNCRSKKLCNINNCKKYHHKSLHKDGETVDTSLGTVAVEQAEQASNQMLNCRKYLQASKMFKILPVTLTGPLGSFKTYAMFDEGSSISLIDENTSKLLGLKGKSSNLTLQWYGEKTVNEESYLVNLEIEGTCIPKMRFPLKNVHTIKKLDLPCQSFSKKCSTNFASLPLEDYIDAKPVILLGLDNAFLGTPNSVKESNDCDLIAMQCKLGWLVYGLVKNYTAHPTILFVKDDELKNIVNDFLATENFGVNPNMKPLLSDDDQVAKEIMENTIKRIGNRFEIGLLWKKYPPKMPSSYNMSENRLKLIEKKFSHNTSYAQKYCLEINKYLDKGYARKLSEEEVKQNTFPVWYLPHFGVVNPHKPDKLRVVFDAAAKTSGISLNSLLLKGPEQAKPLLGILLKFRQGQIAVAADIREMFSQIKIRQEDQHAQRFLWRCEKENSEIEEYAMVSMTFGAICSPCCAEYVKNYNAIEFSHKFPEASKAIIENHYVDDFVCSFKSENEAITICQQVVKSSFRRRI